MTAMNVASSSPDAQTDADAAFTRELRAELASMPHHKTSAYVHVHRMRPDLVDDGHLLSFLEVECFDVPRAARRLARYWRERHAVFGPEKFALPLTLEGAMSDSIDALRSGVLSLVPELDGAGRAVIYNSTTALSSLSRQEKVHFFRHSKRVWWYLTHLAKESMAEGKGFVVIANLVDSKNKDYWSEKWNLCRHANKSCGYFPGIHWEKCHLLGTKASHGGTVAEMSIALMTALRRSTLLLHNGTVEGVLQSLAEYDLTKNCLSTEIGGTWSSSSMEAFLIERVAIEGGHPEMLLSAPFAAAKTESDEEGDDYLSGASDYFSGTIYNVRNENAQVDFSEAANANQEYSDDDRKMSADELNRGALASGVEVHREKRARHNGYDTETSASASISDASAPRIDGAAAAAAADQGRQNQDNAASGAGDDQGTGGAARRGHRYARGDGDPRMNRAVQIKLANPDISPAAALMAGGFVFPGGYSTDAKNNRDTEGVSMYQRRNQLSRRVRDEMKRNGTYVPRR